MYLKHILAGITKNKDENAHRYAVRGEKDRKRDREMKREERECVWERERDRERDRKKKEIWKLITYLHISEGLFRPIFKR